jgi:EmrB/QacA subfamily drug resistance transporter
MTASGDERIPWPVWRLALVIVFGAFLSGLDTSVVNVGLDVIARDLGADLAQAQWIANGYLLAFAVSLPACGWLGRRVGVTRLWTGALAAFTVASGLCALAPDARWLIALRVVQGLAAGLLIPAGQTVLGQAVGPQRLGRVMATLGLAVTLAPALGPVLGGFVVHAGSWPLLFLVNVPIGALGLLLARRYLPRSTPAATGLLDVRGLVLVTAAVPLLVYGATAWGEGGRPHDPAVLGPLVAGAAALAWFVRHARRTPHPVLDLGLFRNPAYTAAVTTGAFAGAALFGAGLLFPLYFQLGRGEDPLTAGLLMISASIGTGLVMPVAGMLVDRFGGGVVSTVGAVVTVLTTVPFAVLDVAADGVLVQVLLLLRGAAVGLAAMPATTAAYKAVTAEQLPDATTQVNILQRVGGSLGGAVAAVVLAAQLPAGPNAAFHAAFWVLTAASALGAVAAGRLLWTERASRALPAARQRP